MCPTRSDVRIDLALAEVTRLRNEIDDWLDTRRELDSLQQYSTQLDALEQWLHAILEALDGALAQLPAGGAVGEAYQACRDVEKKATWTRQVWRFYADKFDQREDPNTEDALKAADEAVWSCFAGVYSMVPGAERPTVPLPYIEPLYSPHAVPRDLTAVLRDKVVDPSFLDNFLEELPVPIIGLPDVCSRAPWWLIYIGHEVGHHLQYDLLPGKGLVTQFRTLLRQAVIKAAMQGVTVAPDAADLWDDWSLEVFADAFSVYSLGPRAAWAIAELVMGNDAAMLKEWDTYPQSAVRLALMAELPPTAPEADRALALADVDLKALTTKTTPVTGSGGKNLRAVAKDHLELLPALAQEIDKWDLGGLGCLCDVCHWQAAQFAAGGIVDQWHQDLLSSNPMALEPNLDAPRLILSGGLAAWTQVSLIANKDLRAEAEENLADRLVEAMVGSREEGKRAAEAALPLNQLAARSAAFAQKLLSLQPEELGL